MSQLATNKTQQIFQETRNPFLTPATQQKHFLLIVIQYILEVAHQGAHCQLQIEVMTLEPKCTIQ